MKRREIVKALVGLPVAIAAFPQILTTGIGIRPAVGAAPVLCWSPSYDVGLAYFREYTKLAVSKPNAYVRVTAIDSEIYLERVDG